MSNSIIRGLNQPPVINAKFHPAGKASGVDSLFYLESLSQSLKRVETERSKIRSELAKKLINLKARIKSSLQSKTNNALQAKLNEILSTNQKTIQKLVSTFKQDMVELALKVAEHILRHEVSTSSKSLLLRLKETLEELPSPINEIFLNPKDYSQIGACQNLSSLKISSSNEIAPGKALLKSETGDVVVDWAHTFNQLRQQLIQQANKSTF